MVAHVCVCRTFSAVFEERIPIDMQPEFCGQPHHPVLPPTGKLNRKNRNNCMFGLMSPRGVRKAGWRGFELLHTHAGTHRLNVTVSSNGGGAIYAMATTNGTASSLRVFLSWWANPMYNGTENAIAGVRQAAAFPAPVPTSAPPCPGFVGLTGDCSGHNLLELSKGNLTSCGSACNTTASCAGFSFNSATNYENCVLKSINGCSSPKGGQFVFYRKIGTPMPPPKPGPPPPPPPTPPPPRTVVVHVPTLPSSTACRIWLIDSTHANAHKAWVEMGKPGMPTSAQMAALHMASELHPKPCTMLTTTTLVDGEAPAIEVTMSPDSAMVLDFSAKAS